VWAEVRAHFPSDAALDRAMDALGVGFDPVSRQAALAAGALWRERADPSRVRVVADYLIGAHARYQADAGTRE
jgi:predicted nucleic acid-binding protein